jgi:DNA (cytosine-5)-methyltransferase 1
MSDGRLPLAPIWDDVRTLKGEFLELPIDIIYGGFPCQDISAAGAGIGLGGERSGLFQHIARLVSETNPRFVFLENVPAIRTRGLNGVVQTFTELGYDCRWTIVSAAEVGAPHLRKRWFLLAHANGVRLRKEQRAQHSECERPLFAHNIGETQSLANTSGKSKRESTNKTNSESISRQTRNELSNGRANVANPMRQGSLSAAQTGIHCSEESSRSRNEQSGGLGWWAVEPSVGRVAHGIPNRVDRLRGLGNAVVPLQAKIAFMRLIGIEQANPHAEDEK